MIDASEIFQFLWALVSKEFLLPRHGTSLNLSAEAMWKIVFYGEQQILFGEILFSFEEESSVICGLLNVETAN